MDAAIVSDVLRDALGVAIKLSAPMLILALAVGVLIAIFQAVTQIQIVAQVQFQFGGHDLDVHGFNAIVNSLDLFRCQVHLFQMGIQVRSADHAFLTALRNQCLQSSLQFFIGGLGIFLCVTHVRPLFIFSAISAIFMPFNYTLKTNF